MNKKSDFESSVRVSTFLGCDAVLELSLEKQLALVMGYLVDILHYDIVLYIADRFQAGKN